MRLNNLPNRLTHSQVKMTLQIRELGKRFIDDIPLQVK